MLPIVLAGACAVVWGIADFSGGKATQRAHPLQITVLSQLIGLPVLVGCLLVLPGRPGTADLFWGAAAGTAGFVGIILLYRGLAAGAMTVVAPITAVTAAVVPLAVGLVTDRMPSRWALVAACCAVVAIALVSVGTAGESATMPRLGAGLIGTALAAGLAFGGFNSLIGQASPDAGAWPLAAGRASSIVLGVLLMSRVRPGWRLTGPVLRWTVAAGALDIAANAFFVAAVARGPLSVVGPLASLAPASTVLLAFAVERERIRPVQGVGLGLAAAALVLAAT